MVSEGDTARACSIYEQFRNLADLITFGYTHVGHKVPHDLPGGLMLHSLSAHHRFCFRRKVFVKFNRNLCKVKRCKVHVCCDEYEQEKSAATLLSPLSFGEDQGHGVQFEPLAIRREASAG